MTLQKSKESPAQKLQRILEENILTNAVQSEASEFRQELSRPEMRSVFKRYKQNLESLFRQFAGKDKSMDIKEFSKLLKAKNLLDGLLQRDELDRIFSKIQHEDDIGEIGEERHLELIYPEFLEVCLFCL